MPWDSANSWKAFSASCCLGNIFLAKSCQDAWKSSSGLARGQVNMVDVAKLGSPIHSTLKRWLYDVWSGVVVEKNWALSADWCRLQALQFSLHLIDLLSVLFRWNGFTRIQKVVVDQTVSRQPVTVTFLGASLALGSALELLSPTTEPVIIHNPLSVTCHNPIEK